MQRELICLVGIDYWCEKMHPCVPDGMAVALATHILHSIAHPATADATRDDAKVLGHSRDFAFIHLRFSVARWSS